MRPPHLVQGTSPKQEDKCHLWLRNRVLKQSTRQGQEAGSPGRDEDEPLEDIEPLSLPVHCCLPSQLEEAKKETAGRRVAGRAC